MIELIAESIIRRKKLTDGNEIRGLYGSLTGITGICLNLMLCIGKGAAGILSGSIAIAADAANNLSDALSSVITLLGFRLAGQKADAEHPFGHGRYEYLAGLFVALAIIIVGVELGKESVDKLLHPSPVSFSGLTLGILAASILVKLVMVSYNRRYGKKLDSETLLAVAKDSLNDVLTTSAVLVSALAMRYLGWPIDGWTGMAVAAFIILSGIGTIKDTMDPLLGMPPSPEYVEQIRKIVMSHPEILGIHDLVVHNYGPGRTMISLHAEVSAASDLISAHDVIDNAERELGEQLHCQAVIHLDPIVTDDAAANELRRRVAGLVRDIDPDCSIHDFRVVAGPTHTNLIFDLLIPYQTAMDDVKVRQAINDAIDSWPGTYHAVITVDRSSTI